MPRAITSQTGWPGGEWSPHLIGRFDLEQYNRALSICENFIPLPQGAVIRRPPTRFLFSVTGPVPETARLIPMATDGLLILMTPGSFSVFNASGDVVAGPITHPFTNKELDQLAWASDVDVVYLVCPTKPPYKITRVSPTTFTMNKVSFLNGRAPLAPINTDASKTATISGTYPNSLTITMSSALFISADVGRAFFLRDFTNKRALYMTITNVVSPTVANAVGGYIINGPNFPNPGPDWAIGLFSDVAGCNAVCFHESRLWYGGFLEEEDLVIGSVSNSFDNFETISPDPLASSAANADRSVARRVDGAPVVWMASAANSLIVGAARRESIIVPGVTGFLTPTEAAVRGVTERGSELGSQPARIDNSIFFIERGGKRIRQIRFSNDSSDQFETVDATILTGHFTTGGIWRMAYHQIPFSILWGLDKDGWLYGWTIEGEQQVLGGHRHKLGGGLDGRPPKVLDISVAQTTRNGETFDSLFLVVQRLFDGSVVTTVEVLEFQSGWIDHVSDLTPPEEMIFAVERIPYVDCYKPQTANSRYFITDAVSVGGEVEFTYVGPDPSPGEEVVFRGLAWQKDNRPFNFSALNRDFFTVQNLDTTQKKFRVRALGSSTNAKFSDYGLPDTGVRLYRKRDNYYPIAGSVVSNLAALSGDPDFVYVADTKILKSLSSQEKASFVFTGYRYQSRLRTMPLRLASGLTPSDAGEPVVPTRVTLRLRATIGGEVRVASGSAAETLVMGSTSDLMDNAPVPAYRDFTLPVNGSWGDDGSIVVETDSSFPMEVLGIYANLKTNLR